MSEAGLSPQKNKEIDNYVKENLGEGYQVYLVSGYGSKDPEDHWAYVSINEPELEPWPDDYNPKHVREDSTLPWNGAKLLAEVIPRLVAEYKKKYINATH